MEFSNDFKPAWWLPGGHLQTMWPSLFPRKNKIKLSRERLLLADGDFIDLDWLGKDNTKPLVIILHGLEGSINSSYAKGMLSALEKSGFQSVFMHFRGCSGEHNKFVKSYHAGETNDFDYVLQAMRKRNPSVPLAAIGFSLGANVLLKYLGETQNSNPLSCAIAISTPFELNRCSDRIQNGFSSLYQKILLYQLRKKMLDKNKVVPFPVNLDSMNKIKNFWKFDDLITAKLYGFKDVNEYYTQSSSKHYLHYIKKPTLIVHALNDPFLYADAIPHQSELPSQVKLELYKSGGHMGFVTGKVPWKPKYWLEKRVPDYIKKMMSFAYFSG